MLVPSGMTLYAELMVS